jgi:H+-transporting ATPase
MRLVLGIATVLGLVGPIAAFGLFYLGDRVFQLGHLQLQTMMYLMLSVAGHLTIFQTRTRGPWWSTRPAWILLGAVFGTQVVATLIAMYGVGLVTPLGWMYTGIVWAYAFACFLITDPVKLLAYKILDTAKADTRPSAEAGPKLDAKAQPRQVTETVKADAKPGAKAKPGPDAKAGPAPGKAPSSAPAPRTRPSSSRIRSHNLQPSLCRSLLRPTPRSRRCWTRSSATFSLQPF